MSKPENRDPEDFLTRWSSRKLANRTQSARQVEHAEPEAGNEHSAAESGTVATPHKAGDTHDKQPFDPAQLPPLDSIGADTNIAAFLGKEVSPDLTRAALRRAWTSDPAIKNFVGLVENGWDFNDPTAMSGFGPISAQEVARLVGKVIEALPEAPPEDQTEEALTSEQKSQLASSSAQPAGSLEEAPKPEDPVSRNHHDAAQQNDTSDKGQA
jgi:hypothetical protein